METSRRGFFGWLAGGTAAVAISEAKPKTDDAKGVPAEAGQPSPDPLPASITSATEVNQQEVADEIARLVFERMRSLGIKASESGDSSKVSQCGADITLLSADLWQPLEAISSRHLKNAAHAIVRTIYPQRDLWGCDQVAFGEFELPRGLYWSALGKHERVTIRLVRGYDIMENGFITRVDALVMPA